MLENKWDAVSPQAFTANGTIFGQIQVGDTAGFRIKQVVVLTNNTFPNGQSYQVKRVLSSTVLIVGAIDNKVYGWGQVDISGFTVASGAAVYAEQQPKNPIPPNDHQVAIYESDPVVADRVVQVDQYGKIFNENNPIPVSDVGSAADKAWDDLLLTRDSVTQDITVATYKKDGNVVRTLTFTYDSFENLIEVVKS